MFRTVIDIVLVAAVTFGVLLALPAPWQAPAATFLMGASLVVLFVRSLLP